MLRPFEKLHYAFQPIVNARSGALYAVEALLRGVDQIGFDTVPAMFDAIANEGSIRTTEKLLHTKAMIAFNGLPAHAGLRLFLNLDSRVLDEAPFDIDWLEELAFANQVPPDSITIELTERFGAKSEDILAKAVGALRSHNIRVALDDFGLGVSGLKLCFDLRPDIIKIDRYFLANVDRDPRRRVVVSSILSMAHGLGILVVAEGIETANELRACQELGVDLVQGYYIARPTSNPDDLHPVYEQIVTTSRHSRRNAGDAIAISAQIQPLPPISVKSHMLDVLEQFRLNNQSTFLPVVDHRHEPVGIVRESDIKFFAYDRYGRDLLRNKSSRHSLRAVISRCPIIDLNARVDELVHAYPADFGEEGVLIVDNRRYVGFLSSRAILSIVSERNIANARDQNPLTRLPGHKIIMDTLNNVLMRTDEPCVLAYFDFDNFKPFNDTYGFRQGDRALVLFADLMVKWLPAQDAVIAHIGGDDFFAAFRHYDLETARNHIKMLLDAFRHDVESFYDPQARAAGRISARDRNDQMREFPLMRVSCAIANLKVGRTPLTVEALSSELAAIKHQAKVSEQGIAILDVGPDSQAILDLAI